MSTSTNDLTERAVLEAARAFGPAIRSAAEWIEAERRLPDNLVDAMADAGLFKLSVPTTFGGAEVPPATLVRVIEEVAGADASTGWCLMTALQLGTTAAFMPEAGAHDVFDDPRAFLAGVVAPAGRAVPVEGGYRVSGRWKYASGCLHATWLTGACVVQSDGASLPSGQPPASIWALFPVHDCQIIDTWHVTGLRGTGSHDFTVTDLFVPEAHTFPHSTTGANGYDNPIQPGPLYAFGISVVTIGFPAVSLGIARGALDAFVGLVSGQGGSKAHLRDNAFIHSQLGEAETRLRAARAFLFEAVERGWESATRTDDVPPEERLLIRLAARHAGVTAAQVVESLWYATGAAAIFESNPLERRFRDVHAAAQRYSPTVYTDAGRFWLGLEEAP